MRRAIAVPVNNGYDTELELLPCKKQRLWRRAGAGVGVLFCSMRSGSACGCFYSACGCLVKTATSPCRGRGWGSVLFDLLRTALGTLTALLPVNARRYDTRIGVRTGLGMLTAVNGTIECTAL